MEITDMVQGNNPTLSGSVEQCQGPNLTFTPSRRAKFNVIFGKDELSSPEMWRSALVESLAAATLMFALTSSIISCLESKEPDPKLLVPIAVFINVSLLLVVTVPLSGGHMNPVLTFTAVLRGKITFSRSVVYFIAQCIGSTIGFAILKSVMNHEIAEKYSLGGCLIRSAGNSSSGLSPETALLLEFMCTFLVLFIGVTVAFDSKQCKELGLVNVCMMMAGAMAVSAFLSITITGHVDYAGVGLNPARCFGAALVQGGSLWYGHWVFWVGPFFACLVYYVFSANFPREGMILLDEEHGIFKVAWLCYQGGTTCTN